MRYLIIFLILFSCSENKVDKALMTCADKTFYPNASDIESYILKNNEYKKKLHEEWSKLPNNAMKNENNKFLDMAKFLGTYDQYSQSPFYNEFKPFLAYRSRLIRKELIKIPLKIKKNFQGYIRHYQDCENARKINPKTFDLKFGE